MTGDRSDSAPTLQIDNRLLLGAVILALAWFVGTTFLTESACLAYVLLAFLVGFIGEKWSQRPSRRDSLKRPLRLWGTLWRAAVLLLVMIAALVLIFAWRMAEDITETSSLLVLAVDMIAHYGIALLCILWAVWPRQGHVTMMVIALVTVLMAVAGGGVSSSRTAQTAVGLATVIGFVLSAQVILSRQRVASVDERRLTFRSETWPYLLLALSLFLIAASAIVQVIDRALPKVQAEVFAQLKDRFESPDSESSWAGGGYVSGSRLGSVQQRMLADPKGVALSGYCDNAPGYLRGNVFDSYSQRRWRTRHRWQKHNAYENVFDQYRSRLVRPSGVAAIALEEPVDTQRLRFPMTIDRTGLDNRIFAGTVEIHGQPEKGPQTFLPAATMWIEARGEVMGITPHGLVSQGLDTSQPWVAGVAMSTEHEVLSDNARELMTSIEPSIHDEIAAVAAEVCLGATSPSEKAERIAAYFQNNFLYSLAYVSVPRGIDPVVYFLQTKHPAHCELFATASTLMMRAQGVPARYVSGYVMDELDESKEFYVARNRDAHTWVEYYDDRQQRWVSLESTPGRLYKTLSMIHRESAEDHAGGSREGEPFVAMSWLRDQWGRFAALRTTDVLATLFNVLQLPMLLGLVLWLWWRRHRDRGDAQVAALAGARRAMDRRLRRRGWTRRRSETLHQFADRLDAFSDDSGSEKARRMQAEFAHAAQWYREHAVALYRQSPNSANHHGYAGEGAIIE